MDTNETAFVSKTKAHEARVADDNALEAVQFVETEGTHARLRDRLP